jgi:hypothetical protein
MKNINEPTSGDIAVAVLKGAVGGIAILGATAQELVGLIIISPLEKRKQKFLSDFGERLRELEKKGVILDDLSSNEQFIDAVLQAFVLVLKTSEEAKLKAFKNAISNIALGHSPEKTICQIFLNLIDSFTPLHIKILYLFNDPQKWFLENEKTFPKNTTAGLNSVIEEAYPEWKSHGDVLDIIWDDLKKAGLHNSGTLRGMMSGSGLLASRTTTLGKLFLDFITYPE